MRFVMLLTTGLLAVGLVAGCGHNDAGSDEKTSVYLDLLHKSDIHFDSDADAIAAGKKACEQLKSGSDAIEVSKGLNVGDDAGSGAFVVGAAIGSFCPDQSSKILPD
ncbi:DUF732 domain-containing protein [Mycobacterium koreense]|uniref:Uncharacterized protein n=1 Tax=Mycolicibacillus koreensis TaxID=1069220 RepID=A0A7I7SBU0_9MYCO|nr:DUF732 domain-containing protein [Mycolicibacillus koreensis]MCV7246924.1 DUF732 domain-containing protein [Mycolicibacillus koreensis]ODR11508.1 hypothetical protein BHQ15_02725 [Mycolicibacillus koreensis]OSC31430.1 hypothetical protein B8W67_16465 [Mycolicibacillus koreensis]BBY53606.1 hypothetical protein MKOR_08570 [Mycolicibacillus koreensis]